MSGTLEAKFDISFTAALAQKEKQIQQSYRPIIGIHKWFARRPGTVFRNLLLSEFNGEEPLESSYWRAHRLKGVIADPFMGGGTPIVEANRLGFSVVGTDINPMAFWIVRQSVIPLDLDAFASTADAVAADVEREVGDLYLTSCCKCGETATVKYFIWVKAQACPLCGTDNDLFPGYLLAEASRHPRHVIACVQCGHLNEYQRQPTREQPERCNECHHSTFVEGPARRNKVPCRNCGAVYPYPPKAPTEPPRHRMWAIEYHCDRCKPDHQGRFFKKPDEHDIERHDEALRRLSEVGISLPIPDDAIPVGDETKRLHRWGYTHYRQMFNDRQLLGLGRLLGRIRQVGDDEVRHALLTVFSDFLRYQNMLCRYDTYALKCQDIFSVHGFPVGLIQCENNILGIPGVGSGAFRHFVKKYVRAKTYCQEPFETRIANGQKEVIPIQGERIEARLVKRFPANDKRQGFIKAAPATELTLRPNSLDGVFTDPPYFDNVQYAELMDFCFVWLRLGLGDEFDAFRPTTTRAHAELTGNETMGRGLEQFTEGLSRVFHHYAGALKRGAPFVFTYHHNDPIAYVPLVVSILDAGLDCTAALPAPAEMEASLHIAGSQSSVLDTVFVCRKRRVGNDRVPLRRRIETDLHALARAGLRVTSGDVACLLAGHLARLAVNRLRRSWKANAPLADRMALARERLAQLRDQNEVPKLIALLGNGKRGAAKVGETHDTPV